MIDRLRDGSWCVAEGSWWNNGELVSQNIIKNSMKNNNQNYGRNSKHRRRYQIEEGFSEQEIEPTIIIQDQSPIYTSQAILTKNYRKKNRQNQPKTKLKYLSINQSTQKNIRDSILDREFMERRSISKSLQLRGKVEKYSAWSQKKTSVEPLFKSKRTLIGENLSIPNYAQQDIRIIKSVITADGQTVIFQSPRQNNTHGLLRRMLYHDKTYHKKSFLQSKFNILLKQRLKQSFVMPKISKEVQNHAGLQFINEFESSNLELVAKVSDQCYDMYLRNDTNTHGHQNWFYFMIKNHTNEVKSVTINVCNVKRDFSLIHSGQKIFMKEVDPNKIQLRGIHEEKQKIGGYNFSIKENTNPKIARGKIYKLSFTIDIQANKIYEVSMLPAYTYSKMLQFIEEIEQEYSQYVRIDILTYSLMGLAIPLLTITNKQSNIPNKKVVLISCRIHPGETISSHVMEGFIRHILENSEKKTKNLIDNAIIYVVPMINPDGVIFGNFRTNFLGIDMNRGFNSTDEILHPEIVNLKDLGKKLKREHGNNFLYFLDLHGHSCQKNIFTYGPSLEYGDQNYYNAKLLPVVLQSNSKYFDYESCTFHLEEHKNNTARGFFLKELNVLTYTVESSYAIYDDYVDANSKQMIEKLFQVQDWLKFGSELADSISICFILLNGTKFRSHRDIRKAVSQLEQSKSELVTKIKNTVKKKMKEKTKKDQIGRRQEKSMKEIMVDSDGESDEEDLNQEERKEFEKKVQEITIPSYMLPKVAKPAIVYPTVTPKLFEIDQEKQSQNFKYLFTKRNKYSTCKVVSPMNSQLPQIYGLQKLKPQIKNIKIEKRHLSMHY